MNAPAEADIPAASRPALDAAANQLGFVPNMHRALAASPKALNAFLDFKKAMSTTLDAATRQGIAHAVTQVNGCNYCDAMHTWVSPQLTHVDDDDDEIARNRFGSATDARRAAALAFAREVALTRGRVADDALAAVRAAGFTDAQILDIVALVVQFSMTNCLLCVSVGSAQAFASGSGALNVLLHCDDLRPTEVPLQFPGRHGNTVAAMGCCPRHEGRGCIGSREDAGRFWGAFYVSG